MSIQVTVVSDNRFKCDARCGIDWSSAEAVALVKERIEQRFGDRVAFRVISPSQAKGLTFKEANLPVLLLNGQPRIYGQFDIRGLLDVIDAELEIRRGG